jgi:hypothetical protein
MRRTRTNDRRVGPRHLSQDQVKRIRRLSDWPREKLARAFDTELSNVYKIINRTTHR